MATQLPDRISVMVPGTMSRHRSGGSGVRGAEGGPSAVRPTVPALRYALVCRFQNDVCSSGRVSSQGRDAGGLAGRHILK